MTRRSIFVVLVMAFVLSIAGMSGIASAAKPTSHPHNSHRCKKHPGKHHKKCHPKRHASEGGGLEAEPSETGSESNKCPSDNSGCEMLPEEPDHQIEIKSCTVKLGILFCTDSEGNVYESRPIACEEEVPKEPNAEPPICGELVLIESSPASGPKG